MMFNNNPLSLFDFFTKKQIINHSTTTHKSLKKGFPAKIVLFWIFIISIWLFKMIHFCYFNFPTHRMIYQQLLQIQKFELEQNYAAALKLHENLISKYPKYPKNHYFSIARCYLATGNTDEKFSEGIKYLDNKEITEKQMTELQSLVHHMTPEQFLSMFSAYVYKYNNSCPIENDATKIYILNTYTMETEQ